MNIEESVEYLKNCLNDKYNFKNATRKKDKEAIETLLTAYEKEKEKNKELSDKLTQKICKGVEEEILEEYRQTIISKDKEIEELKEVKWYYEISRVPKDKIKAKIEDILNSENGEAIEKLIEWQSLLEKE